MATIPSDILVTEARLAVQQKHTHPNGVATPADVEAVATGANAAQKPIIAGSNITIGSDGRTINATGGGGGTGNIVVSDTPPVGAAEGTVWYDTSEFAGTAKADTLAAGDTVVDDSWDFYGNPVEWAGRRTRRVTALSEPALCHALPRACGNIDRHRHGGAGAFGNGRNNCTSAHSQSLGSRHKKERL